MSATTRRASGIVWWRDGKRRCGGCQGYYAPVAFRPSGSKSGTGDGLDNYCRACRSAAEERYYRKHRAEILAHKQEYRSRPNVRRRYQAYMRRYGQETQAVKRLTAELATGRMMEAMEA